MRELTDHVVISRKRWNELQAELLRLKAEVRALRKCIDDLSIAAEVVAQMEDES